MGANAQTSVPTFTAGEVLTAANMNISARTGVPVFSNTTTRDAGFGGTGEKTLAEGQLCYLEDSNVVQYYDGAAWATVGPASAGALVLVKTQTVGTTVSSVTVTGAFSSTYDNYLVTLVGGVASTDTGIQLRLGASTTGYYWGGTRTTTTGTLTAMNQNNGNEWQPFGTGSTDLTYGQFLLYGPNLAKYTVATLGTASVNGFGTFGMGAGYHAVATAYTDFTILTGTGTLTGGTIRVYGFANS